MTHPIRDAKRGQSALMAGAVGKIIAAKEFPSENVIMAPERYSYEGNWLFCTFDQPDLLAARLGFGLGKFHWQDYGLEGNSTALSPIAFRVELITTAGVHACLFSDDEMGTALTSDGSSMDVRFYENNQALFRLQGWPQMSWNFRSADGSIGANLQVTPRGMAVWPDCILPNNTFSMCIGTCQITGTVFLESREIEVSGGAVYDHPRVLVRPHAVPPFGWYLYAPLRFPDGTFLVSYSLQDGLGKQDPDYSVGFLSLPDQTNHWFTRCQVRGLKMDNDDLPTRWETELTGPNVRISYRSQIVDVPVIHMSSGLSIQDDSSERYLAFPLLMSVEGECMIDGITTALTRGSGIAEFLARKGYQASYP